MRLAAVAREAAAAPTKAAVGRAAPREAAGKIRLMYFFNFSLICFFPFFDVVYILIDLGLFPCLYSNRDFDFTMISFIDLGLFPCIYSNRSRIILMYIF
jgi:hypothetical protein